MVVVVDRRRPYYVKNEKPQVYGKNTLCLPIR